MLFDCVEICLWNDLIQRIFVKHLRAVKFSTILRGAFRFGESGNIELPFNLIRFAIPSSNLSAENIQLQFRFVPFQLRLI